MGYSYKGKQVINNTLKINGHAPIDQRTVIDNISDVFITLSDTSACPLYKNAYKGMVVSTFDESGNVVLLSLKNDAPYRVDNTTLEVDAENYLTYWTEINESNISTEIIEATYFQGGDTPDTLATLVPHGCLDEGTTIADLETMTISEILKEILFETVEPKRVDSTAPKATIAWQSYTTPREVGSAMPTTSNIKINFTADTYKNTASNGTLLNTFTLNKLNTSNSKFYFGASSSAINTDMSSETYANLVSNYVQPGTFYVRAEVAYDAYQDAKNSVGVVRHAGYGGTVNSTSNITFVGTYKILSNALHTYTNKSTAWSHVSDRETKDSTEWVDTKIDYSGAPLVSASATVYYKWPSGTNAADVLKVYVPQGYKITSVKVASDTATDTYNTNWSYTKTEEIRNDIPTSSGNGPIGSYQVYTIVKADSMTNVEVKISTN